MQGMAYGARDILSSSRPLREFGELLHEAWMAKRGLDHGVSNHAIDEMYEQGRRAGAWGGKLLGAGGGGFMLFLAPPELHPQIMNHFQGFHAVRVRTNAPGSNIIFSHA